ncbi:MFS transporter [Falsarthrobacter nasiphocae]|uniref:MFS family permease n=1 Tax=Falsarthrobacter nasiphocae TaxID=189863 RepID=A0AAE3YG92_9MICC|nr:MFS transporter [Falsarthrobacter nasiphocae]MDR6892874.1 MFS family permease [Falsarthrobacter nasiphocae]
MRPLVGPVYVPSLIYAAGASALVPAQVILALQLGFSPAAFAGVMTWIGAFAVFASVFAGRLVDRWGDKRALIGVTVLGGAGLLLAALAAADGSPWAKWVLVVALTLFDLVDAVWSIARQGLVMDLAPVHLRGRAMSLYGACQRLGRLAGPLLAAPILAVASPLWVLPVTTTVCVVALAWLIRHRPSLAGPPLASSTPIASAPTPLNPPVGRRAVATLGGGALILEALRISVTTLVPLWAVQGAQLNPPEVALLLALISGAQLVLFWPAGVVVDRWGLAPVTVTAMAGISLGLGLMPLDRSITWLVLCGLLVGLGDGVGAGVIKQMGAALAPVEGRAAFLGHWQGIASAGSLASPALSGVAIAAASLPVALVLNGGMGLAGAAWMAVWVPRLLPRPGPR